MSTGDSIMVNRKVLADASMQAQRLHARLRTDYSRPVDIFRVVQELGIWLCSRPLGNGLFGFYLREGDAAGIVLNSSHPEYLQRYTCAHELGHHVLGHQSHLDDERDITGDALADRPEEHAAQMFAGGFLMPIQAVNRVQRRLGIDKNHQPNAEQVYAMSRELDVSFSAAAWQLVSLRRLSSIRAAEMVRTGAAETKRRMRPGPHPRDDNRAGLVLIDESGRDIPVLCRPGDELRIRLPENESTGFLWHVGPRRDHEAPVGMSWDGGVGLTAAGREREESVDTPAPDAPVALVMDQYHDGVVHRRGPVDAVLGEEGEREFVFLAQHPGRQELVLTLCRPWEEAEVEVVTTRVRVGPPHQIEGIAGAQRRGHVARIAAGGSR